MIVEPHRTIGKCLFANGIERTGDGLDKGAAALTMRALKGTETGVALIACKHTVLTSDNACDQVAVAVGISHTLAV